MASLPLTKSIWFCCDRNALSLEPDNNKLCNLATCLIRMDRILEAKSLLEEVRQSLGHQWEDEPFRKSFERANEMLAEREHAIVADKPDGFLKSSSSDNFSSRCSSGRNENKALAGNGTELGNINKKNSNDSFETVEQNSPDLITQPRECKWRDEEVYQSKWNMSIGAARMLRFGNHYQKNLKCVETAASTTNGKKLDQNLIEELHQFIGGDNAECMTSKARKMCTELLKEQEDNEKHCLRIATETSSAYGRIKHIGQRSV